MNKKFLSAIMCGAMLTASTSVFVSCEDYGDDIAHLQTQIDQNATTAASELAAKVAALESQLSTLKAAQDGMKDQLANAKAEAAAAANAAMSAAQAAQAAADAAQNGADDAKAAAAAAQATADAANKTLADAVARVAVLETKVASLEATIAGLTASDKELNAKLSDLQVLANSLNNTAAANTEEIKAIKAEIASKTAELAGQVAKISAEFGAKIDAINAELNTIKANYATKDELNKKAAELAATDAKLAEQIAANEAYIATMQEAIAALEAEDAELAALIAANQAAALAEIEAINETLAAQQEAVEAELATIYGQIEEINGAIEQLVMAVMSNKNSLEDFMVAVETVVTDMQGQISDLINIGKNNWEAIVTILENLDELNPAVSDMQGQIEGLIKQAGANYDAIVDILVMLDDQASWNEDIQKTILYLQEAYLINDGILEEAISAVAEDLAAVQEWATEYEAKYDAFVKEQNDKIAAELKKLENISAGLVAAQADIAELQNKVDAIINGLQSIVFVPMYKNADFDIPVYHIETYSKDDKGKTSKAYLFPESTIKFRVEPAGYAAQLAAIFAENKDVLKLEGTNDLVNTRATYKYDEIDIVSATVENDDFLVLGVKKNQTMNGNIVPTTLVVTNKYVVSEDVTEEGETVVNEVVLSKTSDYFRVKYSTENPNYVHNSLVLTGEGTAASFKAYNEINRNAINVESDATVKLYHSEFAAFETAKAFKTVLRNATSGVLPYAAEPFASDIKVIDVVGIEKKDGAWTNKFFTVKEDGEVCVNSEKDLAIAGNAGEKINVILADAAYGYNADGTYMVTYNVEFEIVEKRYTNEFTFNFGMEWPKTTATAQEITVKTIAADEKGLAEFKLSAEAVFQSMFDEIGEGNWKAFYNNEGARIVLQAVAATKDKEAHILVTPYYSLANSYYEDVEDWEVHTFSSDDLYSDVTIFANFDFTIPGIDAFFSKVKMYWNGENNEQLEVNYSLRDVEGNYRYVYYVEMNNVYTFNDMKAPVDYSWAIDQEDVDGIWFSGNTLLYVWPAHVDGKLTPVEDLTFTMYGKSYDNELFTQGDQKFNVTYPINSDSFKAQENVTFGLKDLKAGKEFKVTELVSLSDVDGHKWIEKGQIYEGEGSVKTAWGISNLNYEITNVTSAGQNLTSKGLFHISNGNLIVTRPENITKLAEITIKVSVDYNYQSGISQTYKVYVDPAK